MASPIRWTWVWVNLAVSDGQGSLVCCSPRGHKVLDKLSHWTWWLIFKIKNIRKCSDRNCYKIFHSEDGFYYKLYSKSSILYMIIPVFFQLRNVSSLLLVCICWEVVSIYLSIYYLSCKSTLLLLLLSCFSRGWLCAIP